MVEGQGAVAKALDLLQAVGDQPGATLSELAATAGLAVSTAHRHLATLESRDLVARDAVGRYSLGVGLIALAGRQDGDALTAAAHGHLVDLVAASGETAHLGVVADDVIVYTDKVESPQSVRLVSRVGARVPLASSAMGKAILALDPALAERVLAGELPRRTPKTLDAAGLARELDVISRRAWAIDDEENELGVRCVGAAIRTPAGRVLGAISISGPAARFTPASCEALAPAITAAADAIGARLG